MDVRASDAARFERGDWMITHSGKRFFPLDPRAHDVDFRDIGHALSLICRYGGHVRRFYSVAEHSRLLAEWFEARGDRTWARWALVHDAPEYVIGDMVRPLKRDMPTFALAERRVERAVFDALGLEGDIPPEVHAADSRILVDEVRELFRPEALAAANWFPAGEPLGVTIVGEVPHDAERAFAHAFARLFPELAS